MPDEELTIMPKRNEGGTMQLTITLPKKDMEYISSWARNKNTTISRAIHDHIWMAYYAQKGEYRHYEGR